MQKRTAALKHSLLQVLRRILERKSAIAGQQAVLTQEGPATRKSELGEDHMAKRARVLESHTTSMRSRSGLDRPATDGSNKPLGLSVRKSKHVLRSHTFKLPIAAP